MKYQNSKVECLGCAPKVLAQSVALVLLLAGAAPALAEVVATPTQNIMSEIMSRQQQMQAELRELRDLLERQGHELEMLKRASKEMYMDTDQRIRALDAVVRPMINASQPTGAAPIPGPAAVAAGSPVELAVPPSATMPAPASAALAPSAGDQERYDEGLKLLRAGRYQPAIQMFDQIIKTTPPSSNRPNALYWTGEAYLVLGDLKSALNAFEQVVQDSPAHQKSADAQLKMGYIYYDQKNHARAREILNRVKAQFPGTQAATLADQRLKRMQSEGV